MTRQDYFLLSKTLKEAKASFEGNPSFYYHFTDRLMKALKADNPSFSETRFKIALYDEGRMAKTRGNLTEEEIKNSNTLEARLAARELMSVKDEELLVDQPPYRGKWIDD